MTEYRLRVPEEGNGGQAHWVAVHLPECWAAVRTDPHYDTLGACICDRLRACEARVRDECQRTGEEAASFYARGLDAARDAVRRCDDRWSITTQNADTRDFIQWCFREARAAIDALREQPTATARDIADDRAEHEDRDGGPS